MERREREKEEKERGEALGWEESGLRDGLNSPSGEFQMGGLFLRREKKKKKEKKEMDLDLDKTHGRILLSVGILIIHYLQKGTHKFPKSLGN